MHYYSFHVSDYHHDTSHLSPMEDLAFRRLLDLYYTSEKPIPNKTHEVARRIRLPKNERDVQTVLEEFFMFDMDGNFWYHKRCDETIAAYQLKAQRNREVGRLGGRPKGNPDGNQEVTQTVSKQNPNQEPITNNHKPIDKATVVACPEGLDVSVWQDWLKIRKTKKAPLTATAWKLFVNECQKAGWTIEDAIKECCLRNWASFKADWMKEKQTNAERLSNTMSTLTRGLTTPKPFWAKPDDNVLEATDVKLL